MRYHHTPIRMAKTQTPATQMRVRGNRNALGAGGNTNGTATVEGGVAISYKAKYMIQQSCS